MTLHCSPPGRKRPRQDSPSPGSAPARKTTRSQSKATSTSTSASASATDHGDIDTTMEDADDSVLFETSAPAPPPQHHHTRLVTGSRPTKDEIYGTIERAETLTTAFNSNRASTPLPRAKNHSPPMPHASDSRASALVTRAQSLGHSHRIFRPAGARRNSSKISPNDDPGCRPSVEADSAESKSRNSSRVEISPLQRNMGRAYDDRPIISPSKPRRLALQQAQSLGVALTPFTISNRMAEQTFGITTSPAPYPATYVSHRASFLGASTDPGAAASGNRGGAGLEMGQNPCYYRRPTAESEDETIPERPPTRRGRGTSQDLLRAQEAVRRQKEEDADDELAEQEGEDVDEDDEDDEVGNEKDGMNLN